MVAQSGYSVPYQLQCCPSTDEALLELTETDELEEASLLELLEDDIDELASDELEDELVEPPPLLARSS